MLKDLEVVGSESQVLWYLALSLQLESLVSWKLPAVLQNRKIQPWTCLPNSNNRLCDSDTQNACQGVLQAGGLHTKTDTTTEEYFLKGSSLLPAGPLAERGWFTVESSSWAREGVHFFNAAARNRPAEHELRCPVVFCPLLVSENHSHQSL